MPISTAVVGTGVIGSAWAALFLSRGYEVRAHDPSPDARDRLLTWLDDAWPALAALGYGDRPPLERLRWCDSVEQAVATAGFVQESGPEDLVLKQRLVAQIDAAAPAGTVIASSSSGLRPSQIQEGCSTPDRVLVGHPFHPAHLVPLVEVVPGSRTSSAAVTSAMAFYTGAGKRAIEVRAELPGHVVNRLQAALWREAYSLVDQGVVSVAEVDAAIVNGPGLRWAVIGPFAGQHLSGGTTGISRTLEHLGPPMVAWWDDLGSPRWTPELVERVVAQTEEEFAGTPIPAVQAARDRVMLEVLRARSAEQVLPR
jgi:3-hydroxyacyl-CoA dehydrogenase